jgi:hypothetical protein
MGINTSLPQFNPFESMDLKNLNCFNSISYNMRYIVRDQMHGGVLVMSDDQYDPLDLRRRGLHDLGDLYNKLDQKEIDRTGVPPPSVKINIGNCKITGLVDFRTMVYKPLCAVLFALECCGSDETDVGHRQHYVIVFPEKYPPTIESLVYSITGMQ